MSDYPRRFLLEVRWDSEHETLYIDDADPHEGPLEDFAGWYLRVADTGEPGQVNLERRVRTIEEFLLSRDPVRMGGTFITDEMAAEALTPITEEVEEVPGG